MTATTLIGQSIQQLNYTATNASNSSFRDLHGKNLVLYFYPKDHTSGCTQESKDFRDHYPQFQRCNTEILGISRDSLTSHNKFIAQHTLPFALISDTDESLCNHFAVLKQKSMYGKSYWGIERSTFLIDPTGIIRHEWRNVKVPNHVQEVLAAAQIL